MTKPISGPFSAASGTVSGGSPLIAARDLADADFNADLRAIAQRTGSSKAVEYAERLIAAASGIDLERATLVAACDSDDAEYDRANTAFERADDACDRAFDERTARADKWDRSKAALAEYDRTHSPASRDTP